MAVPSLASGLIAKIPGGAVGAGIAGAALVYLGSTSKVDGVLKGVMVGSGAGLATIAVLQLVFGGKQTVTA